ncbi:unnamed protein product [Phytomonas sp. EM1]|nr:unnamed protein product [Phytomonas sp. EM1]|eukprot:CCW64653.1 unnamed protein product [Phytomonas sp. isolate EM1]
MVGQRGSAYEPSALDTSLCSSKPGSSDGVEEGVGGKLKSSPEVGQGVPLQAAETLLRKALRSVAKGGRASVAPRHHSTDLAWVSHGYSLVYQRGPLSLSGGLYAAIGYNWSEQWKLHKGVLERWDHKTGKEMDHRGLLTELLAHAKEEQQGVGSAKHPGDTVDNSLVDIGTIERTNSLRTMNVLQLMWELTQWQWRGVLNVRLLPISQHTYVPLFDYSVQTPWLSSSLQSDELSLNWCGFLTLYQRPFRALAAGATRPPPVEPLPGTNSPYWWSLRRLDVGVGASLKHDLRSGFNLYWGWAAYLGRGLSFSSHIDMLRRLSCSASSCLGPLDLSMRVRLNLITLHNTTLDVGGRYRPFPGKFPRTAMRASTTGAATSLGFQVDDLTHEFFAGWIARHREERLRWDLPQEGAAAALLSSPSPEVAPVAGGGWIFGWAAPAWGYLTSGWTTAGSAVQAPSPTPPPPPLASRPHGSLTSGEGRGDAAGGCLGFARCASQLGQRLWLTSKAGGGALKHAVTSHVVRSCRGVQQQAIRSWVVVRRLDWLEEALDGAHLDLSVGITHGAVRGGDHGGQAWSTFIILSSH